MSDPTARRVRDERLFDKVRQKGLGLALGLRQRSETAARVGGVRSDIRWPFSAPGHLDSFTWRPWRQSDAREWGSNMLYYSTFSSSFPENLESHRFSSKDPILLNF